MDPRNPIILVLAYCLVIALVLYAAAGLLLGPWAVIKILFF